MMKIFKKVVWVFGLVAWFLLAFMPATAHAFTRLTDGYIPNNTTWTATGSPYLLDADINLQIGRTLNIEPGVVVKGDPNLGYLPGFFVGGTLNARGTRDKPINFSDIYNINIYYTSSTLTRLNVVASKGVIIDHSTSTISSSTISGSINGLYVKASSVNVAGSRITGNNYGIYVDPVVPVYLYGYSDPAHQVNVGAMVPSNITVVNSSLIGNKLAAIKNAENTSTVSAKGNWWGDVGGPLSEAVATSSKIIGQVNYTPWLDHDPTIEPTTTPCCSSVLFIPGIEGSWLYRDEASAFGDTPFVGGTSTNTLWVPNRNDDVRKLFLDSAGKGLDSSVYSGEPIANVFNVYSVYTSFMKFMDSLVNDGKIGEWKSFGYDWRKPITEVVAGVEKKATTTISLVDVAKELASRSRTGKLTIVAHSNGGLVAEYLVKVLADAGKADIVDSVVSVATPYLGTPTAISSLLYGDGQSIAAGLFLKSDVAQQLAQNMPSAYSLLPSREYFKKILDPVVSSTTFVDSFDGMSSFLTSHGVNSLLASAGDAIQSLLAGFHWPANIYRWSLVGWNSETPKRLVYMNKEKCQNFLWFRFGCSYVLERYEDMTTMGDGTVVAPSAAYASFSTTSVVSIDLASTSITEKKNIQHVNILESSTTQSVIRNILLGEKMTYNGVGGSVSVVSSGEPDYKKEAARLVVSVDSGASLSVRDSSGNHTGPTNLPAGVVDDAVNTYEENIPGSHYLAYGQDKSGVSLLPSDQPYTVSVNGGGFGTFTLNVEHVLGTTTLGHTEYTDIPMTPSSTATTIVRVESKDGDSGAPSSTPIRLDIDGDGTTDFTASSTVSSTITSATSTAASATTTNDSQNSMATNPDSAELFKKYLKRFCGGN